MRARTCRYSNTSNLLRLIGSPGKKPEGTGLRKFEMRFGLAPDGTASPLRGSITPILRWLQYADHRVARLRRSCTGSITAIIRWLDYADPGMARICRSVTTSNNSISIAPIAQGRCCRGSSCAGSVGDGVFVYPGVRDHANPATTWWRMSSLMRDPSARLIDAATVSKPPHCGRRTQPSRTSVQADDATEARGDRMTV